MPAKVPQKLAVANGIGSAAPAARPTMEEAATAPTFFCTSVHVTTEAAEEHAILIAASFRKA